MSEQLDPRTQALQFHKATYSRITWPEGAQTVFVFKDGEPVTTVPTADAEAFADIAASNNHAHQVWATVTPRKAGTVVTGGYKTGTMETIHDPQIIFVDTDVQKPGYPATIEDALAVAETFALTPHAITCSGSGLQLIFLLETPLVTTKDRLLIRNLDSAYKDHLNLYGYKMDDGVTTNLTRPLRVPGSWNRKPYYVEQMGGPLQAYLVKADETLPLYTADDVAAACPEDRSFTNRYADTSLPGTKMAIDLPIGKILSEAHGWTLTGDRWCSNVAGSSTERSAARYFHEEAGVETAVIWSSTTAEEYGVKKGHPYSSFDWLTHTLCNGNYGLATRLAARSMEAGDFSELLALFQGKADGAAYTTSELADVARQASTAWPEGLDRYHSVALAFRGVAADVATARGYKSVQNLAAIPGLWAESLAEQSKAPVTVEGSGLQVGVHSATKPALMAHTVRADRSAKFQIVGAKGQTPMDHPERGMTPFMESTWSRGMLDANPLCKDAVLEREIPLVLVSAGVKYSLGQIHADAILSAARREALEVAVVSSEFFTSTMVMAGTGENSTRANRAGSAWSGIPLRDRVVYLAGRQSWRRTNGLVELAQMLSDKGAAVHILDFPQAAESFGADVSEASIADYLAGGHKDGSLKDLMNSALTLEQAVSESKSYDPASEIEVAQRVTAELHRLDTYRYHEIRSGWIRNEGTHWVPSAAPIPMASEILERDGFATPKLALIKSAVRDFAAADQRLWCNPMDEETDPLELNVLNGVLNLKTGALRSRRHGEVFETVARANFVPGAVAERWQQFMDEIMPDRTTQAYLQEAIGAAATGSSSAEVLPILVGSGANGKSIFMRTAMDVLGSLASTLSPSVLIHGLKDHQWASLQTCRLLGINELPEGLDTNTGVIKALSSTDKIDAAFKYGQSFGYIPAFSTFIMTNHLPRFKEMDDGTWRRLSVVKFGVTIPAEKRDRNLLAKLAQERDGILSWILEGSMRYLANGGLTVSEAVATDTAAYKMELDVLGQFLASGLVHLDPQQRVNTRDLHETFYDWMATEQTSEAARKWNVATIAQKLQQHTVEKFKSNGKNYYTGIALGPSVEQVAESLKVPDTAAELAEKATVQTPTIDPDEQAIILAVQRDQAAAIQTRAHGRIKQADELARGGGW